MIPLLTLLILSFIFLFFIYRENKLDLFNPNVVFTFYWVGLIVMGLLFSIGLNYRYSYIGIALILVHVLAYNLGFLLNKIKNNTNINPKKGLSYTLNIPKIRFVVCIMSMIGFGSIYILMTSQGYSLKNLLNISHLFEMANALSIKRYDQDLILPVSYKITSALLYSGVFFSSILFVSRKSKLDLLISLFPLFLCLINAVVNGARAGLLMAILLFITSIIVQFKVIGLKIRFLKILKNGGIVISIFLFILVMIQFLRGGNADKDLVPIIEHMSVYLFGSINAFSIWWESYNYVELSLGKYTFSGIYNSLFGGRVPGLFSEPIQLSSSAQTNVYTMFRGVIEDFSIFGSILFYTFFGNISGSVYRGLGRSPINMVLLSLFYFIITWSFIVNPLTYNTIFVSWIINLILIKLIAQKEKAKWKN